jgi:hypothetical protein
MQAASCWRYKCGDECYDPRYDLDDDCNIDVVDIMLVVHWGEKAVYDFVGFRGSKSSTLTASALPNYFKLWREEGGAYYEDSCQGKSHVFKAGPRHLSNDASIIIRWHQHH